MEGLLGEANAVIEHCDEYYPPLRAALKAYCSAWNEADGAIAHAMFGFEHALMELYELLSYMVAWNGGGVDVMSDSDFTGRTLIFLRMTRNVVDMVAGFVSAFDGEESMLEEMLGEGGEESDRRNKEFGEALAWFDGFSSAFERLSEILYVVPVL